MKTLKRNWNSMTATLVVSCALLTLFVSLVFADDVPTPLLKIEALGGNQFLITVENGVTNANYEIWWRAFLSDTNYPWQLVDSGGLGETTWMVDAGGWLQGFFRVSVGNDWDADGVLNWMDAGPNDPDVGALTVTIDSPVHGQNLQ